MPIQRIMMMLSALTFALWMLAGCSSGPAPGTWKETRWPDQVEDIDRALRGIMTQRYGYQVTNYERVESDSPWVRFKTEWNYRHAQGAVFSGSGVRRMAWVEIRELYDDNVAPPANKERSGEAGFVEPDNTELDPDSLDPDPSRQMRDTKRVRFVSRDGKRRLAYVIVAISIEQERNVSIMNPGDVDKGEWREYGSDQQQVEHILSELRWRMRDLKGREFEMSEKGAKVHERGLTDKALTPEERARLYEKLTRPPGEQPNSSSQGSKDDFPAPPQNSPQK